MLDEPTPSEPVLCEPVTSEEGEPHDPDVPLDAPKTYGVAPVEESATLPDQPFETSSKPSPPQISHPSSDNFPLCKKIYAVALLVSL